MPEFSIPNFRWLPFTARGLSGTLCSLPSPSNLSIQSLRPLRSPRSWCIRITNVPGVGAALIEEGLKVCRTLGHRIVIVIGHPGYYPRYGFRSARANGIVAPFTVADDVFMVLALDPGALDGIQGTVKYPEAFDAIYGSGVPKSKKGDSLA